MPEQVKKNPNDPDWENINPEIALLARQHGFIKQPIELYLTGQLTWLETLETIILLLTKEYRAQSSLLIQTLSEQPHSAIMLTGASGPLLKSLPKRPLALPQNVGG